LTVCRAGIQASSMILPKEAFRDWFDDDFQQCQERLLASRVFTLD
jgi:hypothetical protein